MLVLAIGIVLVLVGAATIHFGRDKRWRPATFFVGFLALLIGLLALYFAYWMTTDEFGR